MSGRLSDRASEELRFTAPDVLAATESLIEEFDGTVIYTMVEGKEFGTRPGSGFTVDLLAELDLKIRQREAEESAKKIKLGKKRKSKR